MAEGSTTAPATGFTQEQVNSMVANARRDIEAKYADYDDLKKKAQDAEAAVEAQKSDLQKLQGTVDQLATDLKDERLNGLKSTVAAAAKLSPAQAAYLKGSTQEELQASAAKLQEDFGIKPAGTTDDGGADGADGDQQTTTTGGDQQQQTTRRPVDQLQSAGSTVTTTAPDESDPDKLADLIGRR